MKLRATAFLENEQIDNAAIDTRLQLIATAAVPISIIEFGIAFDGTSSSAEPVDVKLVRQTTAGTSTAMGASEINVLDGRVGSSVVTAAYKDFTANPTEGDVLWTGHVHPQTGIVYQPPGGITVPESGRIALLASAAATINANLYITFEE